MLVGNTGSGIASHTSLQNEHGGTSRNSTSTPTAHTDQLMRQFITQMEDQEVLQAMFAQQTLLTMQKETS